MKRVFLIVLDSLGIGAAPDTERFGDAGTNTLKRISASSRFHIPNLLKMGLGNIDGVDYLPKAENPTAAVARLTELSAGKDTTIGHFELMGILSKHPIPQCGIFLWLFVFSYSQLSFRRKTIKYFSVTYT